jgi:predicted translin family RNA/ssDNA-binding protein
MAADQNAPATKKDLAAVTEDVAAIKKALAAVEDRLSEQVRDMQTELLEAFFPWQQDVKIQFRELEVNTGNSVTAVKERMDIP